MRLTKYIACICEGSAEQTIIRLLLDSDKLIFSYNDLIDENVIRCRSARNFENQYLGRGYSDKITIIRILDSRREMFPLRKAYLHKIENIYNVITAPEIEMLIIFNQAMYNEYKRSGQKPSIFCKTMLGYSNVKCADFIKKYFSNIDDLIYSIKEYKRISDVRRGEYTLADLLKSDE